MVEISHTEGQRAFGADPAGYHEARPGYPERVFDILRERLGSDWARGFSKSGRALALPLKGFSIWVRARWCWSNRISASEVFLPKT